jgi:hypothetical protein
MPLRWSIRPSVEQLETRLMPATFNLTDTAGLIQALQDANAFPNGTTIINLQAGMTYTLTAVNNYELLFVWPVCGARRVAG